MMYLVSRHSRSIQNVQNSADEKFSIGPDVHGVPIAFIKLSKILPISSLLITKFP